ncbi:uncharacterized protein B0I36DRAFT_388219 [Microdochium trichocladiopsis]|uniref:Cyanovirin-N domain-containing protein n=1 Tax=Microdochium trichocladiopsis TaxID=1682393 RepID=A0A9P8XX43_9PEZI|nr:uncharacterized protein B0I36DRAFT_388219 [Microdochium trichocladiopsis]KAH7021547.1 hypothetical protein B0I36DRAFT_388219 [Microdochium trichocladiopsis]
MKAVTVLAFISSSVLAAPAAEDAFSLEARAIPSVGLGQQIQADTQINDWVVWEHGKTACPNTRAIAHLVYSPCGIKFTAPGSSERVQFCSCIGGTGAPTALCDANGKKIRDCKTKNDKINCHNGVHDIVQHRYC